MAATKENPIIFYDVMTNDGPLSPNTYKTRATLNYKRLPYRVEYVSAADIEPKLKAFGVRPTNPTSNIKYTLPVIADPSSEPNGKPTYVVDSFDIAVYLDQKYPAPKYPVVFAPGTRAVQRIVSNYFTTQVGYSFGPILTPLIGRPGFLDDRGREYFLRTRAEHIKMFPEPAAIGSKMWGDVHDKWEEFGKNLDLNEEGPFVMGNQISFVDFAIGGTIHWLRRVEGGDMLMWKTMAEWQGGRWARLWAEMEKLEENSNQVV